MWLPGDNPFGSLSVAAPLVSVTGLPELAPSTVNCTVPAGVPEAADTVAVKLNGCPATTELAEVATTVVVAARLAVSVRLPLLPAKFASPP